MKNDFGADDIIKPLKDENKIAIPNTINPIKTDKVELSQNKYLKFFELNEEGLKLYGQYKKQQWLSVIKWSFLGTALGFSFGLLVEFSFKKMSPTKKDFLKTIILIGSIGLFSLQGYYVSTYQFQKQQNELAEKYGKEV